MQTRVAGLVTQNLITVLVLSNNLVTAEKRIYSNLTLKENQQVFVVPSLTYGGYFNLNAYTLAKD